MSPTLQGIDHVHVYVSNRTEAARWYHDVMGLVVSQTLKVWAEDPLGPLTLEDTAGNIHLALFQREDFHPTSTIAFRATGEEFLQWLELFKQRDMDVRCSDHDIAWSLYFSDIDDNTHEITTYDYDFIKNRLR